MFARVFDDSRVNFINVFNMKINVFAYFVFTKFTQHSLRKTLSILMFIYFYESASEGFMQQCWIKNAIQNGCNKNQCL